MFHRYSDSSTYCDIEHVVSDEEWNAPRHPWIIQSAENLRAARRSQMFALQMNADVQIHLVFVIRAYRRHPRFPFLFLPKFTICAGRKETGG